MWVQNKEVIATERGDQEVETHSAQGRGLGASHAEPRSSQAV